MASEEQYLDELLNHMNNTASERSMEDVMREMMGGPSEEEVPSVAVPENVGPALEQPSEDDLEAMLEGINSDAIADVMDVLEDPSIFTDPSMAVSSEEVPVQEDLEALLSGMEETPEEMPEEMPAQEDLEALLSGMEETPEEAPEEMSEEMPAQDDLEALLSGMEETPEETPEEMPEEMPAQDDLEAMLSGMEETPDEISEEVSAQEGTDLGDTEDLDALFSQLEMDENATAVNDDSVSSDEETMSVVDQLDETGGSDEDLLSLLEGIDDSASEDDYKDIKSELPPEGPERTDEEIDALLGVIPAEDDGEGSKKKKKKKGFSLPFFGKKKNKNQEEAGEDAQNAEKTDEDSIDELLNAAQSTGDEFVAIDEADEGVTQIPEKKGGKKQGFFARLIALLTEEFEEEEEEAGEEKSNEDIIAEVDAENAENAEAEPKGKKGKKEKKSKKDKKGKGAKEGEASDSDEESEEGKEDDSKKKKKPKKEKAPKEPKEKEPKRVVLSKKAAFCLVCFCITLVAAVVILSTILPDEKEKSVARRAYLNGDYNTTYENLYGKKLNESDTIIYKRSKDILTMQRRWDSYNNRVKLGQKAEAIDSLIEGIFVYNGIIDSVDPEVKGLVDEIYQRIVNELSNTYGISLSQAMELYSLEDSEYTDRLFSIAYTDGVWVEESTESEDVQSVENTGEGETQVLEDENQELPTENPEPVVENPEQPVREDILPEEEDLL